MNKDQKDLYYADLDLLNAQVSISAEKQCPAQPVAITVKALEFVTVNTAEAELVIKAAEKAEIDTEEV